MEQYVSADTNNDDHRTLLSAQPQAEIEQSRPENSDQCSGHPNASMDNRETKERDQTISYHLYATTD